MTAFRRLGCAAVLALVPLVPLLPTTAHAAAVPAGDLAFITTGGQLDLAAVQSDGTLAAAPVQIAPVTTVAAPESVQVSDVVVSR